MPHAPIVFLLVLTFTTPSGRVTEQFKMPPHSTLRECTEQGEANGALFLRQTHQRPDKFSYRCEIVQ